MQLGQCMQNDHPGNPLMMWNMTACVALFCRLLHPVVSQTCDPTRGWICSIQHPVPLHLIYLSIVAQALMSTPAHVLLARYMLWIKFSLSRLRLLQIGPRGAQQLADALRRNRSLTELDLRENNIGPLGMKRIADALAENDTLRALHLQVSCDMRPVSIFW